LSLSVVGLILCICIFIFILSGFSHTIFIGVVNIVHCLRRIKYTPFWKLDEFLSCDDGHYTDRFALVFEYSVLVAAVSTEPGILWMLDLHVLVVCIYPLTSLTCFVILSWWLSLILNVQKWNKPISIMTTSHLKVELDSILKHSMY
jgi:hypothetical protein